MDQIRPGCWGDHDFISEVATADLDASDALAAVENRLPWYARSVDSNYLPKTCLSSVSTRRRDCACRR